MEMTPKLRQAVKDYKAGKTDSFTILYEESNKYIYTCIYKVLSGNDNAQELTCDMMQDTYVEISKSLGQLDDEERFLAWAGTIARRKCYAYIKKNKKYVLLNEEDDTFENLSDSDDIIPEEVMQSKEKQRLIREIIDTQLTEMQKLCIIAYYYNEQKQSEIAEELGIPENTVKTNLSRAKAKIKEGVLDLEKTKGTKLYSVAPLFLLLFKEDIMAAVVPQEMGVRVVASVTEAVGKGVEAGTSVSTVGEAATSNATTSTVVTKTGTLGKMAVASVKTKLLMGVATIAVAGTIGGVAIASSQTGNAGSGNHPDNGIVNESQMMENTQNDTETISSTENESAQNHEIEYVESEACFQVMQSEYVDRTLEDGEILDWAQWERVGQELHLGPSINIYSPSKGLIGYTKENIKAYYVSVNGKWSNLAIGESGYSVYVLTEDLQAVLGATETTYEEGIDICLISNGVYEDGYYDGQNIDMNTLSPASGEKTLNKNINIYSFGKRVIGYVKAGSVVKIITQNDEWTYVSVADGEYVVRTDELNSAE